MAILRTETMVPSSIALEVRILRWIGILMTLPFVTLGRGIVSWEESVLDGILGRR